MPTSQKGLPGTVGTEHLSGLAGGGLHLHSRQVPVHACIPSRSPGHTHTQGSPGGHLGTATSETHTGRRDTRNDLMNAAGAVSAQGVRCNTHTHTHNTWLATAAYQTCMGVEVKGGKKKGPEHTWKRASYITQTVSAKEIHRHFRTMRKQEAGLGEKSGPCTNAGWVLIWTAGRTPYQQQQPKNKKQKGNTPIFPCTHTHLGGEASRKRRRPLPSPPPRGAPR